MRKTQDSIKTNRSKVSFEKKEGDHQTGHASGCHASSSESAASG
jgi:hypothetical protein